MKHLFILAISILTTNTLFAQRANKPITGARHGQVLSMLLQHRETHSTEKTTTGVTMQRVIGQSTHDSTGTMDDSVALNYAANMGSTFDFNTMVYPHNYPYASSPMFNFAGVFTKPQVLFDTCMHWTQDPFTLVYGLYEASSAGYDAAENMVSYKDIFTDSTTNTNMSYANSFNAAHNIDSGYWFRLSAGATDSTFEQFFSYSTTGLLTRDSVYELHGGTWRLVAKSLYAYDASSNLTQIDYFANDTDTSFTQPLQEKEQYQNTYDASNRLLTVLTNLYDGTSLAAYVKDTFAYTGTPTYHTSWKEYQYDPINAYWAPMFFMSKIINGAGLPDTVNIDGFDSIMNAWVPQTMDVFKYNSFSLPDSMHEYDYDFTAFPSGPSYNTVYYYETYVNTTATQNIKPVNGLVTVYPNPATNTINILQQGSQYTMASIALVNVNGQTVARQTVQGQGEIQVSVKDLLPGIYWLVVQDSSGAILHRQAIVKQ